MANNSAEHRTAEEIYDHWLMQDHKYSLNEIAVIAMHEFATQEVKAKDDELARVTKLLEDAYRALQTLRVINTGHISTKQEAYDEIQDRWNDYKTKNNIR